MEINKLAASIDSTNLKATATKEDIAILCRDARQYQFAAVCVNPCRVSLVAKLLKGSGVAVATVVGFPLGANTTAMKIAEALDAVNNGATEIDMVINIGRLKEGDNKAVREEIEAVKAQLGKIPLKVIIETGLLTYVEKRLAIAAVQKAGADMIKTSTGFAGSGAKTADIRLFKEVAPNLPIKAAGGIRSYAFAKELLALGVARIGTSNAVPIMQELIETSGCHCEQCVC